MLLVFFACVPLKVKVRQLFVRLGRDIGRKLRTLTVSLLNSVPTLRDRFGFLYHGYEPVKTRVTMCTHGCMWGLADASRAPYIRLCVCISDACFYRHSPVNEGPDRSRNGGMFFIKLVTRARNFRLIYIPLFSSSYFSFSERGQARYREVPTPTTKWVCAHSQKCGANDGAENMSRPN